MLKVWFPHWAKLFLGIVKRRQTIHHRYKNTEVKAALSCSLAKPADALWQYWLCRRAELARAFVDLLITAIFTLAPLINTPCQIQPCALQPAHADQDPSLVSLYSPRQIKMTSKATLDSWTAIRRSLGGWLIDPVYFQHCKAFNIRLEEAQLCSCYSNGLQDSYLFRSTVRLFRPLVPGARLWKCITAHAKVTALKMLCKVLPRKPVPVLFPCQIYKKPNESYSVQLTSFPKTGGRSLQLRYGREKVESRLSWWLMQPR